MLRPIGHGPRYLYVRPHDVNRSVNNMFACGLTLQAPLFFEQLSYFMAIGRNKPSNGGLSWFDLSIIFGLLLIVGFLFTTAAFFVSLFLKNQEKYKIVWIRWVYGADILIWVLIFTVFSHIQNVA